MSGTLKVGGKTLATHDTNTNVAKIQLGSTSDVVITDSAGTNVLSESGGVVTLTADKVGIGTDSPSSYYANHLVVDIGSSLQSGITIVSDTGYQGMFAFADGTSGNARYRGAIDYNHSNDSMAFLAAGAESMRIDSSGNLLINTTTTTAGTFATGFITVELSNTTKNGLNINSLAENYSAIGIRKHNTSGTSYPLYLINSSNTNVGSISMTNSGTSFNELSDYRLKENITNITDGITRVKQLNPSRFNFISDPDVTVDGFIAHEVSDIVPEAITGEKDAVNEDGSINPQGIDKSKLVPLLTAALQEAIGLIESQQSQIDALTAKTQEQDLTIASLISRIEALETPAE